MKCRNHCNAIWVYVKTKPIDITNTRYDMKGKTYVNGTQKTHLRVILFALNIDEKPQLGGYSIFL